MSGNATVTGSGTSTVTIANANLSVQCAGFGDVNVVTNKSLNKTIINRTVNTGAVPTNALGPLLGFPAVNGSVLDSNETYNTSGNMTEQTATGNSVFKEIKLADSGWNGSTGTHTVQFCMWSDDNAAMVHHTWDFNGTNYATFMRNIAYTQNDAGNTTYYSTSQRALANPATYAQNGSYTDCWHPTNGGLSVIPAQWRVGVSDRHFGGSDALNTVAAYSRMTDDANGGGPTYNNVSIVRGSSMFLVFDTGTTQSNQQTERAIWQKHWNTPPTVANNRLVVNTGSTPADSTGNNDLVSGYDRLRNAVNLVCSGNKVDVTIKAQSSSVPYRNPKFILNSYTASAKPQVKRDGATLVEGTDYNVYVDTGAQKCYVIVYSSDVTATTGNNYVITNLTQVGQNLTEKVNVSQAINHNTIELSNVMQAIPQSRIELANVYGITAQTFTEIGNVHTNVVKAIGVLYGIEVSIKSSTPISYGLKTTIPKTLSENANVIQRIPQQLSEQANVLNRVTQTAGVIYKVLVTIPKALTENANVIQAIPQTRVELANVLNTVAKTLTEKVATFQDATQSDAVVYLIKQSVTKSAAVTYHVLAPGKSSLPLKYAVLTKVTKTLPVKYNCLGTATGTEPVIFAVLTAITLTKAVTYAVLVTIPQVLTEKANIPAAGTTGIQNKSLTATANMFQDVGQSFYISYAVKASRAVSVAVNYGLQTSSLTQTVGVIYNARNLNSTFVIKDLDVFYNVLIQHPDVGGPFSNFGMSIQVEYAVLTSVTASVDFNYYLHVYVTKTFWLAYIIQAGPKKGINVNYMYLTPVAQGVSISYAYRIGVLIQILHSYGLVTAATATLATNYIIIGEITGNIKILYGYLIPTTGNLAMRWKMLFTLSRSARFRYGVIGQSNHDLNLLMGSLAHTTTTTAVIYKVNATIKKTAAISYPILYSTTRGVRLNWMMDAPAGKNLNTLLTGDGSLGKNLHLLLEMAGPQTKFVAVRYPVLINCKESLSITWTMKGIPTRALSVNYNQLHSPKSSVAVTSLTHHIVIKSVATRYNLQVHADSSVAVNYVQIIRIAVVQTTKVTYGYLNTMAAVGKPIQYKTKTNVLKSRDVVYEVIQSVVKSAAVNYKMAEPSGSHKFRISYALQTVATKAVNVAYVVDVRSTQTVGVRYPILQNVGQNLTEKAYLYGGPKKSLVLGYAVLVSQGRVPMPISWVYRAYVTSTTSIVYDVLSRVTKTAAIVWHINFGTDEITIPQPVQVSIDPAANLPPTQPRGVYIEDAP
jgi:hypothetical protein